MPSAQLLDHQRWIESFRAHLRMDRGLSENTVEAYTSDLNLILDPLTRGKKKTLQSITASDLENAFTKSMEASSQARKVSALRQFFAFLVREEVLAISPAAELVTPKKIKALPKFLNDQDVKRLLAAATTGLPYRGEKLREFLIKRDFAMIILLYATGMRVSELVSLSKEDIDTRQGLVRTFGKGGKERLIPFAPAAGEALLEYIPLRDQNFSQSKCPSLFLNHTGETLTREMFWRILKKLALAAGISAHLSPHVLRHTFATHLMQSGMNLRTLQLLLGHSDLTTTQVYTHVTSEHLRESHEKFHPRAEISDRPAKD